MEEEAGIRAKKTVMVAIDDSEFSHYALEWALEKLGASMSDSELILFTAQPIADYSYIYASSFGAASPELIRDVQENQKRAATALLDVAQNLCSRYGITARSVTEVGDPKDVICEAVEKLKVQLLVLGSHGRGAVKR